MPLFKFVLYFNICTVYWYVVYNIQQIDTEACDYNNVNNIYFFKIICIYICINAFYVHLISMVVIVKELYLLFTSVVLKVE